MTVRITIEPTDFVFAITGEGGGMVPARRWVGTINGAEVHFYMALVVPQTHDPAVLALFEEALGDERRDVEIVRPQ